MMSDAPTTDWWVALYEAAVNAVDEWGDGDNVDPDRMDTVMAVLREALGDA
jgi:hypothetical protein